MPAQPASRSAPGRFNAKGSDLANVNGEFVVVKNSCSRTVSLDGWRVRDVYGHVYRFPSCTGSGRQDRRGPHRDRGPAMAGHLFWGRTRPVWNNKSYERAYLKSPERQDRLVVAEDQDEPRRSSSGST